MCDIIENRTKNWIFKEFSQFKKVTRDRNFCGTTLKSSLNYCQPRCLHISKKCKIPLPLPWFILGDFKNYQKIKWTFFQQWNHYAYLNSKWSLLLNFCHFPFFQEFLKSVTFLHVFIISWKTAEEFFLRNTLFRWIQDIDFR